MEKSLSDYTVDEIWEKIQQGMNENPKPYEGMNVIYQYDLTGDEECTYQLHLADGAAKVVKGEEAEPQCTMKMKVPHFKELLLGRLSGTAAFMTGKLKVKGNIGLAMKLENLLKQYDVEQYL